MKAWTVVRQMLDWHIVLFITSFNNFLGILWFTDNLLRCCYLSFLNLLLFFLGHLENLSNVLRSVFRNRYDWIIKFLYWRCILLYLRFLKILFLLSNIWLFEVIFQSYPDMLFSHLINFFVFFCLNFLWSIRFQLSLKTLFVIFNFFVDHRLKIQHFIVFFYLLHLLSVLFIKSIIYNYICSILAIGGFGVLGFWGLGFRV